MWIVYLPDYWDRKSEKTKLNHAEPALLNLSLVGRVLVTTNDYSSDLQEWSFLCLDYEERQPSYINFYSLSDAQEAFEHVVQAMRNGDRVVDVRGLQELHDQELTETEE